MKLKLIQITMILMLAYVAYYNYTSYQLIQVFQWNMEAARISAQQDPQSQVPNAIRDYQYFRLHYRKIGLFTAEVEGHVVSRQKDIIPVKAKFVRLQGHWVLGRVHYNSFTHLSNGQLVPPDVSDEELRSLIDQVQEQVVAGQLECASIVAREKCDSLAANFKKIIAAKKARYGYDLEQVIYSDINRTVEGRIRYAGEPAQGQVLAFSFYYQPFAWKLMEIKLVE